MNTEARQILAPAERMEKSSRLPVAATESPTLLSIISQVVTGPNASVEIVERMVALYNQQEDRARAEQERVRNDLAEKAYNSAMVEAQAEMRPIATDATNPQTRSKYASYGQLDKHLRPIYSKRGFALTFSEGECAEADFTLVVCDVMHRDGCTKRFTRKMPADGKGAKGGDVMTKTHALGSAQSYGMRYLLRGIFNVAVGEDDDDGNAGNTEPLVNEKQLDDLKALITETKTDEAKLKAYLKITYFDEIPAKNFDVLCRDIRAVARVREEKVQKAARVVR